ncbi:hypothetical protein STPH2_0598 [Streptomyces sp. KO7888]|nr:hypothetical protein [Streptomyces sp. KO7888]
MSAAEPESWAYWAGSRKPWAMLTLCGLGSGPVQSAPQVCIFSTRSSRKASPVRRCSHSARSMPSPQRSETQLESKAPLPWAFMNRRNPVNRGRIRGSPAYSSQVRSAWSRGRNGQKSGPPLSDVRRARGPKKPSSWRVARIASIQRRDRSSASASPVAMARGTYPRSQYGSSSHPPFSGWTQPEVAKSRKWERSA